MTAASWLTFASRHWLGLRLDILGGMLTFAVALLLVLGSGNLGPAKTGLALTYMIITQANFGALIRQKAELENCMNSVERIVHYADTIPQERNTPSESPDLRLLENVPNSSKGSVSFRHIVLRYRPDLPPVLHGINLDICAGQRVAIVGRTGAGKSSLITVLLRLVELSTGSIELDGQDIARMELEKLRQLITVIPQDPVICK
jgi:ABC-type multidrug transport system fused ATPase/permease subunit